MTAAYAASVRALVAVLTTLNEQVTILQGQVEALRVPKTSSVLARAALIIMTRGPLL